MATHTTTADGAAPGTEATAAETPATSHAAQVAWLGILQRPWRSLAIVPAEASVSARAQAAVAADVAATLRLERVRVIDATGATPGDGARYAQELQAAIARGDRVLLALDPPLDHAGAIAPLLAAEAAVVVVRLGRSVLDRVHGVVELVPRPRLIGFLAVRGRTRGAR